VSNVIINRRALLATALLPVAAAIPAVAQTYPSQTVKLVVPFPAGGGVDLVARIIAPPLAVELGQSVIVENRGGAGGALGAAAVAQSAPDGYTLLLGANSTHGTNPSVQARRTYEPIADFSPIALVSTSPFFLLSSSSLPATSIEEFISLARRDPGRLNYGSYGIGSINHLTGELFNSMARIQTNHVPYRGSAPAVTDLIAGRLDFVFDGVSTLSYVKAGSLRALATAGATRSLALPDVPTVAEAAVPGFDVSLWFGIFAPANTSKGAIDLLNTKINSVLAEPRVREALQKIGMEIAGGNVGVLVQQVDAELRKWGNLAREKNIRVDQ
jgi:tripartite-type tricarboxylate transporter receptor subunit TctC